MERSSSVACVKPGNSSSSNAPDEGGHQRASRLISGHHTQPSVVISVAIKRPSSEALGGNPY